MAGLWDRFEERAQGGFDVLGEGAELGVLELLADGELAEGLGQALAAALEGAVCGLVDLASGTRVTSGLWRTSRRITDSGQPSGLARSWRSKRRVRRPQSMTRWVVASSWAPKRLKVSSSRKRA